MWIIHRYIKKLLSIKTVKGFFILCLISVSNLFLLADIAFAYSATPTPTPSVSVQDQGENPCTIYDNNWGSSAKNLLGSGGSYTGSSGLYQWGNNLDGSSGDSNHQAFLMTMYKNVNIKDPIYMPTEFKVSEDHDPVLGLQDKFGAINQRSVLIPCAQGSLTGLVARRKYTPGGISLGVSPTRLSNCFYQSNGGVQGQGLTDISLTVFPCAKDNAINGLVPGGCPMDYRYDSGNQPQYISYDGTFDSTNPNKSNDNIYIKMIYAPSTQLSKTLNWNPNDQSSAAHALVSYKNNVKDIISSTFTNLGNKHFTQTVFFNNISTTSAPSQLDYFNTLANQTVNYIDSSGKESTSPLKVSDYLFTGTKSLLFDNIQNAKLGVWLDYKGGGMNNDNQESFLTNSLFFDDDIYAHVVGLYYINGDKVSNNIGNVSFVCNKRLVSLQDSKHNTWVVPLYEWIPSTIQTRAIPTCESLGPSGTGLVSLPSAVNGKTILACTPCELPTLFQTDIFGQTVLGIPTAIGCLPDSINGLITVILRIAVMVSGGISVFLISLAGIRIALNADNPDEIKKAQKSITSSVLGLLVIICSVMLLNVVGLKLLDISAFGGSQVEYVTVKKTTN